MDNNFLAIHHASYIISDLESSKYFYHDVLGLEINNNRPHFLFEGLWLNINKEQQIHLMLLNNPDSDSRPQHGGRDRHTALRVKDLSALIVRLENNSIAYTLSKSGRRALFCRDPDGNTLEIME